MAKHKKSKKATERKQPPPKATGKRGIGPPLDPKEDFEQPITIPGTPAAAGTVPPSEDKPQGELITIPEAQTPAVIGDKVRVTYVKPHFDMTPKGDRTVALELSFPLVDAHDKLLPKRIKDGWHFIMKKGYPRLDITEVPGQRAVFYLTSDDKEEALVLPAAKVTHASLRVIEEKGTGDAKTVIRLSLRLEVMMTAEVARFAEWNYGNLLYMRMHNTEETLFDEEDEDASEE